MNRKTSILTAVGTVAAALSIGAIMQYWPTEQAPKSNNASRSPIAVTDVQEVSSTPKPSMPLDASAASVLPVSLVMPQTDTIEPEPVVLPQTVEVSVQDCSVDMDVAPAAGAMMTVALTAPCHGGERVTMHHNGLMFTDLVNKDGTLQASIPALAEKAMVIASFLDGSGAVATTHVATVPFFDRVVLQWRGDVGLQLHAREFDADYFTDGHIWHGAEADATRAATGEGGFLVELGNANSSDPLMAEVYSFPSGMTDASGTVALTVEAQILSTNCDAVVEAQLLETRNGGILRAKELTIEVPSCETVGDFLLLKNIVEDLQVASN